MSGIMLRIDTKRDVNGNPRRVRLVLKSGPDGVEVRQLALSGDRWTIRLGAVTAAIAALRDRVGNLPPGGMR